MLFFGGGCRFPADLIFPLGKVTVVLFHNPALLPIQIAYYTGLRIGEVKEKDRTYYEVYSLPRPEEVPEGYKELSFVCLRPDGAFEAPSTVGIMCRTARKKVEGLEDFHFHMLRHTYTSNLLSNGVAPKDVQELLGHADVSTTMNIYAHATREAKRTSARLLDKVIGGE